MPRAPRWAIDWRSSRHRRAPVSADATLRRGRLRRSPPDASPIASSDHLRADRHRTLRRSPGASPIASSDHPGADRDRTLRRSPGAGPFRRSPGAGPLRRSPAAIIQVPTATGRFADRQQRSSPCRSGSDRRPANAPIAHGDHGTPGPHLEGRSTSKCSPGAITMPPSAPKRSARRLRGDWRRGHHMGTAIARQRRVAAGLRDGSTRGCAIGASGSN